MSPNQTRFLLDASRDKGLELLRVRPENFPGLTERSHSFWYNDPWVSSDVLITFLFHLTPAQRGLLAGTVGEATYWSFPADYDARLQRVMAGIQRSQMDAPDGANGEGNAPDGANQRRNEPVAK